MERGGTRLESAVPGGVRAKEEVAEVEECAMGRVEEGGQLESSGVEKGSVIAGVEAREPVLEEDEDEDGRWAAGGTVGLDVDGSDIVKGRESAR